MKANWTDLFNLIRFRMPPKKKNKRMLFWFLGRDFTPKKINALKLQAHKTHSMCANVTNQSQIKSILYLYLLKNTFICKQNESYINKNTHADTIHIHKTNGIL